MRKKNLQLWGWTSSFFALFSVLPFCADASFGSIGITFLWNWFKWALMLIPFIAFLDRIRRYFKKYPVVLKKILSLEQLYWTLMGIQLGIWFLAFLIFYPGTFGADAPSQLGMVQGVIPLSTHHPLLHTLIFGNLITLTANMFGSPHLGLSLYILVCQILFTAYAISKALCSLYRRNVPAWILISTTFFLAINPFVMALVCYTTKDIPFAAALLLFIVYLVELLNPNGEKQSFSYNLGQALLWGLLMSLLRSQGIYMVVMGVFILLFQYRKKLENRKFLVIEGLQISIFLLTFILNATMSILVGAEKADSREAWSVPIQQIATILKENDESKKPFLDENLANQALSYFDGYSLDMIDPLSADNAKFKFVTEKMKQNPIKFLQIYLRLLAADFSGAVRGFVRLIGPYFDMRTTIYNSLIIMYVAEIPEKAYGIQNQSLFPELRDKFISLICVSCNINECPMWLRIFDPTWTLYLIVFLLSYALIFKEKSLSVLLIYPISYILTMLLGPVALLRYSYVYLMEFPYLLGSWYATFKKGKPHRKKSKKRPRVQNVS